MTTNNSDGAATNAGESIDSHHQELQLPKRLRSETILSSKEVICGIGAFRPQWMQPFASANFFVINFSILAILQGALFTYMVGIISTLEKRYAFETKVSGFILIADNLSQMIVSPIVGYLGSKYNRSRLIAVGELIVGLSCFLSATPYFIYGTAAHLDSQILNRTSVTNSEMCIAGKDSRYCEHHEGHSTVILAVVLLWLACCLNGLGYTAFYTIGLPHIDDNIKKKNSPVYLSSISTIRLLGPTLGFVLSSICLQFYENPLMPPSFNNHDPRWIGAWWIGFLILGTLILLFTFPMFLFPKTFTKKEPITTAEKNSDSKNQTDNDKALTTTTPTPAPTSENISNIQDARKAFVRFSKNSLLICHICSGVFRVIGYLGYYIVKPKYIELQYRQSASSASFFTGAASVLTMAIGTMAGGIIIRRFRPNARSIAIFVVLVELLSSLAIFGGMFLQCPTPQFFGLEQLNPSLSMNPYGLNQHDYRCNRDCGCTGEIYQPICIKDGNTNFFSPCYAGCKTSFHLPGHEVVTFHNCSCVPQPQVTTSGLCQTDCNRFPMYITLIALSNTIASTARTGDTLITLRSVDPQDKSFAMGIMGTIFAVFAFIPYPLIFGAIIDSTCIIWEKSCGKTGNCWLYDLDKYRIYMHMAAFSFLMVGVILECGTIYLAGRIKNLYDDEDDEQTMEMKSVEPPPPLQAAPETPQTTQPTITVTNSSNDGTKPSK
ncbi:solute carrier organic anion transporter family member 74D-like [Dermatophagoides pteronyssinus]|uniref:solute carrier organic anion transporter family member 74D-like n=1 Tax=Dermatophagoides pteronyssinus TaxID=6956 RepID=UPI003F665D65